MFGWLLALFGAKKVYDTMKGTIVSTTPQGAPSQSQIEGQAYSLFESKARQEEGYRLDVYKDSIGVLTVGIGHKVTLLDGLKLGQVITPARAQSLFDKDAALAFAAAKSQARQCNKYTADFIAHLALVNFQLGTGWTAKFTNTWNYLKSGQWAKAVANLGQSAWADQTPDRVAEFQNAIKRNFA